MKQQRQKYDIWYAQALDDLEAATILSTAGKYAQSCFCAQQASVKGLRAVWFFLNLRSKERSCLRLIQTLPAESRCKFADVTDKVLTLDKLHISSRYPDDDADTVPIESFTQQNAQNAVAFSQDILNRVRDFIS